jgi:hypothetical protein
MSFQTSISSVSGFIQLRLVILCLFNSNISISYIVTLLSVGVGRCLCFPLFVSNMVQSCLDSVTVETPWSGVLWEKLMVTRLIMKFLNYLWSSAVHYLIHKNPTLDLVLCQLNPIDTIFPL